jgi:hypothetical protein
MERDRTVRSSHGDIRPVKMEYMEPPTMAKKTVKPEFKSNLRERLLKKTNGPKESIEEHHARIDSTLDSIRGETTSPGRGSPQFIVRYPNEAMRAKIARLAKANNRSINAEIVDRLQKSMIDDAIHNLEESMGEIFDRVEKLEGIVRDHADQLRER